MPHEKTPIQNGGFYNATSDLEVIQENWSKWPSANIGCRCCGFAVLDIDVHDEAHDGRETLRDLEKEHGVLPDTWICLTPSGGVHYYFRCDDPLITKFIGLADGIDLIGNTGYVLLPPSIHPSGGRYEWDAGHLPSETPLADLPDWLHEMALKRSAEENQSASHEIPETIEPGSRNKELFYHACRLRGQGFTLEEMLPSMTEINKRCIPPLSKTEVKQICSSACRYARGKKNEEKKPEPPASSFFDCFKPLTEFEEEEAEWLIQDLIPKGQISTIASDGGVGKTTLWVTLISAISAGNTCFLDPPGYHRDPQLVAFLTSEDSVRKKLKKKLREAGANMNNIISPDFANDKEGILRKLKFGTPEMESFIRHFKPALCVFDPLQGFIPAELNMGSRNAMRDCMAPLVSLGEETGTTFCVICHTNKRKGAYGRDRIADSADLWDISRSVLMLGYTDEQGVRYLSHEKSNYGLLQETKLFRIDDSGKIIFVDTTWKRDREYQHEAQSDSSPTTKQDCKEWIINHLDSAGGELPVKQLEEDANQNGFTKSTIRRAKDELKKETKILYYKESSGSGSKWIIRRVPSDTTSGQVARKLWNKVI